MACIRGGGQWVSFGVNRQVCILELYVRELHSYSRIVYAHTERKDCGQDREREREREREGLTDRLTDWQARERQAFAEQIYVYSHVDVWFPAFDAGLSAVLVVRVSVDART